MKRKSFALLIAAALLMPLALLPASHAKNETPKVGRVEMKTTPDWQVPVVQDRRPQSNKISPAILKALGIERQPNNVSPEEAGRRMAQRLTGDRNGRITPLTPDGPGNSHAITAPPSPKQAPGSSVNKSADSSSVGPEASGAGLPGVLNIQSALSAGLITTVGGINNQFSEIDLLADWDGREDMTADRAAKVDGFTGGAPSPNFSFTRSAISETTLANGHLLNVYYYGDSSGNFSIGVDLANDSLVDFVFQTNIPQLVTTGTDGGFVLQNPTAGDCADSSAIITGIAVNPVADLGDFDPVFCGITGEIIYVSSLETVGCASNAANQPIRTRIFAFGSFTIGGTVFIVIPVRQLLRTNFVDVAGLAVDDDGSLYFPLVDLVTVDPATGLGGQGGAIFKATEVSRATCATSNRINRAIASIPTPSSINAAQGTTANPIIIANGTRLTNYSGPSPVFGNIASLTAGPSNVIYAAVAASNTGVSDPTQGLFKAPATFTSGLPSMVITFADATGLLDSCTTGDPATGTLPIADGLSDVAVSGLTRAPGVNNFRIFTQGNGPDLAPAAGGTALVPGTPTGLLKIDMQIDFTIYSGIAVNEEGSVFVIAGGTPAGVGNNPSPNRTEIMGFEDKVPIDRRADFVDFRGNNLPNPPASGGNVGDGDSDRFDHIFYQAPLDSISFTPVGLAGLARGFLRYTNRLAPVAIGPGVTLGLDGGQQVQSDNDTDGTIIFENLDPGHQVAGGDDQNTPFRGDDNGGVGTPALPGALNGGFEFTFGGPVGIASSVWNGFFLNSNGNITFGAGDTDNTATVSELRGGPPRIGAAWADLNPGARASDLGTFPIQALGFANINAFKVRWINVPEVGSEVCTATGGGTSNTFSITLYDDGVGIDENANQPLNPANPIGNNSVPFDLQEGPTDLRFVRDPITNVLVGTNPRREGLGSFVNDYARMDLVGSAADPVIAGYSIGGLSTTNPPGLCETNLSEAARSAEGGPFGVIQSQTSNAAFGLIGEGTEPTIYEFFNSGTNTAPEFDLRFEGNDTAQSTPAGQLDPNRGSVGFFGVGSAPPANPLLRTINSTFVTTPTTTGLINAIGPVTLNILGSDFYPNEVTTVCGTPGGESPPRAGKTVTTAVTLGVDVDGNGINEATIALTNVTVVSRNLITATIPAAFGLPGSPFPLAASGGFATVTVVTTFTSGDNNIFGPFTRTTVASLDLGKRAPVVTKVTPSSGDCAVSQTLAIEGGSFKYDLAPAGPDAGDATVTDVFAIDKDDPAAPAIHASSFTVVDANNLNATINFGGAVGHTFLIFVTGTYGTSRNLISTLVPGIPPGNEAGNLITFTCGENFQFTAGTFSVNEDLVTAPITITRALPSAGSVTVDFATSDGTANQVGDYTTTFRTVTFGPGETSKTVEVPITEDAFVEGNETVNLTLSNATGGAAVGGQSSAILTILNDDAVASAVNPIDDTATFVGQQYHDFFDRQGDAGGVAFWIGTITSCGADPACIEAKRIGASAAFFLSIEFQETGFNVIRSQRVAFGKKSADPATRYQYLPFLKDGQQVGAGVIIGQPGDLALLEANKQAYAQQIVTSAPFIAAYPLGQTASQYVDALFATATVVPTTAERTAAITAFGAGGTAGRTAAFRSVVDSTSVRNAEVNAAFVLLQYYGYLRRNPTDPPDNNDVGYQFWLTKLNSFGGDFVQAEMVKAFLLSGEYRSRFGTP